MKRRELFKKSLVYLLLFTSVQSFAKVSKDKCMETKLIITFKIKKEKLQSFLNIVKDVKINLPQIDGCKGVEVFQAIDDKYKITFIETWENVKKHEKHIKHVVDSGAWESISSHLVDAPQSQYYQGI